MASISITYTPNYEGCHRIYFKKVGNPSYCFYLDNSLSVIGQEKTTTIELVDSYSQCVTTSDIECLNPEVEGYIQACCSSEGDIESRVPFGFGIDIQKCEAFLVSCLGSGISAIFMTNSGVGYTTPPTIQLSNTNGGSGFVGVVNMDGDVVDSVTVLNSGDAYGPNTTISFVGGNPFEQATANIEFCPCGNNCAVDSKVLVRECINEQEIPRPLPVAGQNYVVCTKSPISIIDAPRATSVKATTTCCQCNTYTITNRDKSRVINVNYINCDNEIANFNIPALQSANICAVTNSIIISPDYDYLIVPGPVCS